MTRTRILRIALAVAIAAFILWGWPAWKRASAPPAAGAPSKAAAGDAFAVFDRQAAALAEARAAMFREKGVTNAAIARDERLLATMLKESAGRNSTSLYNFAVHRVYEKVMHEHVKDPARATILELGPGTNLGVGLIFSMTGVGRYYGLDIYRDPDFHAAAPYQSIAQLLSLVAPGRVVRPLESVVTVKDDRVAFVTDHLEYLYPHQSYDIPLADGSVDYVFSNAVLEHIADPERTVQAIHRVLKPGGVTAHQIDLRDHADFSKPLEFLKVDAAKWAERWKDPGQAAWFLNRWRFAEFREAFERAGFTILRAEVNARYLVDEAMRGTFDAKFRGMPLEDLSVTGVFIVARKDR